MVRNNQVNRSGRESFPKLFSILSLANRWTTLKLSSTFDDLFSSKVKIVRTGLSTNVYSFGLRTTQYRDSIR